MLKKKKHSLLGTVGTNSSTCSSVNSFFPPLGSEETVNAPVTSHEVWDFSKINVELFDIKNPAPLLSALDNEPPPMQAKAEPSQSHKRYHQIR